MVSLLKHEFITTTVARQKELRTYLGPMIRTKDDTVHRRRLAFSRLRDREIVTKLFNDICATLKLAQVVTYAFLKCGFRKGDKAPMAIIELVGREKAQQEQAT